MSEMHPRSNVSIALLHYPVYDKNRKVVATAVTNLDVHDLARLARTFGLFRYYLVTPVAEQQVLAERIRSHWQEGWGGAYNPTRRAALELLQVVPALEEALSDLETAYGRQAKVVVTGAKPHKDAVSCKVLQELLQEDEQPFLVVFGTGWGLTDELFERADIILEAIRGGGDYNHLSVRAAVAIILDRLLGER